ncbi:MAG: hypothetical protein Q7K55_08685 [Candidatus Levybacteria bacterium]|nr:hypothetical protein [Candidatus Levybacteria bacterium]
MATTIVNPTPTNNSSNNGLGFLLGIFLLVILGVLFFVYGLPYIRSQMGGGVQISVPKNIDVNLNQQK